MGTTFPVGVLKVSTAPAGVWLWAPDAVTVLRLRTTLDGAGLRWQPVRPAGQYVPFVTEVECGVSASATFAILTGAGFIFAWHQLQPLASRDDMWTAALPGDLGAGEGAAPA